MFLAIIFDERLKNFKEGEPEHLVKGDCNKRWDIKDVR